MENLVRLSKRMSELGLCSRREADEYIAKGWVFVDGERVSQLGTKVRPAQFVSLDLRARTAQNQRVTILLNKPIGYVSGQPEDNYEPAVVLLKSENQDEQYEGPRLRRENLENIAPAGRLDIDSTGLLVFTQDGRIAKYLIGENSEVEKEYLVRVDKMPPARELALLQHGLELDGKKLKPARVEQINENQLRFVLKEGRKRQIRRMCELVGLRVLGLKRVRIGQVKLGKLKEGQWRFLGETELF